MIEIKNAINSNIFALFAMRTRSTEIWTRGDMDVACSSPRDSSCSSRRGGGITHVTNRENITAAITYVRLKREIPDSRYVRLKWRCRGLACRAATAHVSLFPKCKTALVLPPSIMTDLKVQLHTLSYRVHCYFSNIIVSRIQRRNRDQRRSDHPITNMRKSTMRSSEKTFGLASFGKENVSDLRSAVKLAV